MNISKKSLVAVAVLFGLLLSPVGIYRFFEVASTYSSALFFGTNLRYGMENNADVVNLQQYLRDSRLFTGTATGNYYARTTAAVKSLQRLLGITPSGEFDTATRNRTNALIQAGSNATSTAVQRTAQEPALTTAQDLQPATVATKESGQVFTATDEIVAIDQEHSAVAFATWNSHLPKMAVGPEWSYALFSRIQADINNRVAWVYKKKTIGGAWEYAGRVFNYVHQPPGIVLDTQGNVHIVLDCLGPSHGCSPGGVNSEQHASRFYHLVFNGKNSDGSVDFVSTFANYNEWTQESFGYMNLAVQPTTGKTFGVLATNEEFNNHIFELGVTAPRYDFVPKIDVTSKLAYTQFAFSPGGASFVATNELRHDWKSSAEYTGVALYRYKNGSFDTVFKDTVPNADGISSFVFGSDMSFNQQGRLYYLYRKSPSVGKDCNYLAKEGLDGKFTAVRLPVGCLGSYPQIQIDSDNEIRILASTGNKLLIFSSEDDGASWEQRSVELKNLVAGTVALVYPTIVKPWTSPAGYDPDIIRGYYAGMDTNKTGWYAGTFCIPLKDDSSCVKKPVVVPQAQTTSTEASSGQSSAPVPTTSAAPAVPAVATPAPASSSAPATVAAPAPAPAQPVVTDPPVTTISDSSGPVTLSARPGAILTGKFSTLSLSAPNTSFCMIIGGAYGNGQQTSLPTWSGWTSFLNVNTAFTAQCTGVDGLTYRASVTIQVVQ